MRMLGDEDGVSEVFGYILLLGIILTGLAVLSLAAITIIQDSKDKDQASSVGQSFTVADSRLSKARFSTSIFQETPFKLDGGTLEVNGSDQDSYINVYDVNNNLIYHGTLGTIKCITPTREVGLQDGGVWALYPNDNNASIMISPPTFDYNGVTLTLPIMHINGNYTTAYSDSDALIDANATGNLTVVYPSATGGNPIQAGKYINITIKSDYYKAWANYVNERTRATATVNDALKMVNVTLSSGVPTQSGLVGNGFNTKSMDTKTDEVPVQVFESSLVLRNSGNDYTVTFGVPNPDPKTTPDPQLLISVTSVKGANNKIYAYVEFKYINGTLTEDFSDTIDFQRKSDTEIDMNFLNHSSGLTYSTASSGPSVTWGTDQSAFDSGTVDGYDNSSDVTYGQEKSLFDITEHYLWLMASNYSSMGPVYGILSNGNGNGNNNNKFDDTSNLILEYRSSQDIKYLYITEGTLNVSLGGRSA